MAATYLPEAAYRRLVSGLLSASDTLDPESCVIELLGEDASVWPSSILSYPEDEPALGVAVTDALCGVLASLAIDTQLAEKPELRAHVLSIVHRELVKLPAELFTQVSADTHKQLEASFADDVLAQFDRLTDG